MEAWSDGLTRLPAQFHADRAELLGLLRKNAILHESPTQPILSRDGSTARWMLNSLQVTLTPRGAELAGRCVLELLKRFEGRQIATLGLTAAPILNSCIMQSGGRYHGLLIRAQRKQHGSLKLIEGPIDPDEPTILLDDSIASGTAVQLACDYLRDAGIRVEGGIFLVRFGWYGGYARMQEQGYRVEAVTDIWDDFIHHMDGEPEPVGNPTKIFPDLRWSDERAAEGLHPAALARLAMREYLTKGTLPHPPQTLDADYDAAGGAWVSLRSLDNIYVRHARDGFWHFPGEEAWPAPEGVIRAALRTAAELPPGEALRQLDDSAIAVTFFSALEACPVGALDNDRYGIVVRSLERPGWMGGALPRMPGILNEWDQYQHARITNGRLVSFEPHVILRHDVCKVVEPGVTWQPTGVAAPDAPHPLTQAAYGAPVAARARDLVLARLSGSAPQTAAACRRSFAARRRFALCQRLSRRPAARLLRLKPAAPRRGCDDIGRRGARRFPFRSGARCDGAGRRRGQRRDPLRSARARHPFRRRHHPPHPLRPARLDGGARQPLRALSAVHRQPL